MVSLQAAASMVVNVGSFSDPEGLEGLAHFLGISFLPCLFLYDAYFVCFILFCSFLVRAFFSF